MSSFTATIIHDESGIPVTNEIDETLLHLSGMKRNDVICLRSLYWRIDRYQYILFVTQMVLYNGTDWNLQQNLLCKKSVLQNMVQESPSPEVLQSP